ncbi:methyltransferase family protein [Arcticibacterium luteifluviistationis]|uniref:S-isoprenylcysteine methyltransferase n=1 Tax=Arcticibacterium luteifluviistationis TaxID=1784714 RepID=A0A2Z4GDU2_9BACT|nr:isoprenylcysteine carboxylmethyltransferase family protein [Arcticibacterium luteifluviistationis]AWV99416.1 S-isoprenylcysteine methyltransferase [Arcticibacterium luteifluviistationis]
MVKIGNVLYHNRNWLFPIVYLFLFIPFTQVFEHPNTAMIIGFIVAIIGQATRIATIGLVYIIRGGKNRRVYAEDLVTTGIFAHCRNPLYVGNILMLAGLGIASNSLLFMAVIIPAFLFIYQAIVRAEEDFLSNKFGKGFDEYTKDVNRWLPSLKGLGNTLSSMDFKWNRVIIKEYNTTFIWLLGGLGVLYMHFYRNPALYNIAEHKVFFIAAFIAIVAFYFIARYLKKAKIIVSD